MIPLVVHDPFVITQHEIWVYSTLLNIVVVLLILIIQLNIIESLKEFYSFISDMLFSMKWEKVLLLRLNYYSATSKSFDYC